MVAAVDTYIALSNDTTKVVPGHGPVAGKARLIEYRDMLETARERMAKLVTEGKSLDDVYAAKPFADFDAKLGVSEQIARNFMRVVYSSLKN
jgi:glyoxylase-like metal-dependent hydrolase (beta-lactamase superfamily II)